MFKHENETLAKPLVTEHEEHTWLMQQQHPERVVRHLGIWHLGDETDLFALMAVIKDLVGMRPDLNARYSFSDEGDLQKHYSDDKGHCLQSLRSGQSAVYELLGALRTARWDAASDPPFKAVVVHTEHGAMLALLLHPILDASIDLQTLLQNVCAGYAQMTGGNVLTLTQVSVSALESTSSVDEIAQCILQEFRSALAEPAMALEDDFFDFGGHSLLATRVIGRLLGQHGLEVSFSDFFDAASASALAKRAVVGQRRPQSNPSSTLLALQEAPLALAQATLWNAYAAYGFSAIFNLPFALRFIDPVDEALLQRAFTDLIERHASLRTTFHAHSHSICQRIVPASQLGQYRWFWGSAESEGATRASEAAYTFDLARELPIRVRLLGSSQDGQQVLSILIHHLVVDEWSINTLMADLAFAYRARCADLAPSWATPGRSFAEFAQRQHAEGINLVHLDYWTRLLGDGTRGLHLPDPEQHRAVIASAASPSAQWLELPVEQSVVDGLYAFARHHNSSIFGVVYTAIALSLHQLGNLKDIIIGTSASGRTDAEFFDTVGYFTTMVAHRVQFDRQRSVQALLKDITRTINDSMPYADVPLAHIQQALGMRPADELLFDVYIQIHANNALNGILHTFDGRTIRYRQIDPDKSQSMFGLQFEIMENLLEDGQRSLRLIVTYLTDRYSAKQVAGLTNTIAQTLCLLTQSDAAALPLDRLAP